MVALGHILLIADDTGLRAMLAAHLAASGFAVAEAGGPGLATTGDFDALVLDEGTAKAQPAALAARHGCPLVLLARDPPRPLPAGVRACLAKPLRLALLVERLKALTAGPRSGWRLGPWRFDSRARLLDDGAGRRVRLTGKEAAILECLHSTGGGVVAREALLERVWGYKGGLETHTLETHIYRLRRKIEGDAAQSALLLTEDGGYRLVGEGP